VNGAVIILTGPPGAGKTTVADLLATEASVPTVHLTTDLFYRAIHAGFVLPYLPEAQRQNEVVIDAIVGTVATYARGGYDVVVDGIIGPWFLPPFRAAAERDHWRMSYLVLRPDLRTTLARAKQRPGGELKDVDAITGLHGAFTRLGDLESHVIDTSGLDARETVVEVRDAIASGRHRLDR
jgi:cytidylate kinase